MKNFIEKAKKVQNKTDAYLLLIEIADAIQDLKIEKSLLKLEMQKIKSSILSKDSKLSAEKMELTAVENPTYSNHLLQVAKIDADIEALEKIYEVVIKFYNE